MGRARELANLFSGGSADINVKTSDGGILNLQTSDTTVVANDVIGSIHFQAPDEGSGTDAILLASKIEAIAENTFSASANQTSIVFSTADSAAAGTAAGTMTFTSDAELKIKNTRTSDGTLPAITLQTGDTDIAQDDVLGIVGFQAPDEGTGTDAVLVAASIAAVSEGDFSSSSNATKLSFRTASSETAAEKMSLSSAGLLTVSGRIITDDTTDATSTTDGSLQTDGGLSVAKDAVIGDDLLLKSDNAVLSFGADSDVTITHDPDDGLIFKSVATGDDNPFLLTLQTGETDMAANDVMGKIQFQAPDEGTGTDAILVAAAIQAVAEGDFSSSNNETRLEFMTGNSEAATTKMALDGDGNLGIGTTDPQDLLHVKAGQALIESGAGSAAFLRFDNDVNSGGKIWRAGAGISAHGTFSIYNQTDNAFGINVKSSGEVTLPNQPAFLAIMGVSQNNLAANNSFIDVQFQTENFDVNADFNVSNYTFTAPVTGKYQFNASVNLNDMDSSSNYFFISLVTSNRNYYNYYGANHMDQDDRVNVQLSVLADMDASDTAKVTVLINTGTAQADIATGDSVSFFSGHLAC